MTREDESWRQNLVNDDDGLRRIFEETHTIAVLGAKEDPGAPAYYVPSYLADRGYRILPVNPLLKGRDVHGEPSVDDVSAIAEAVDVVEVFRQPEYLPEHAEEILAMSPRPAVVWFQLGIRHDGAAERLARGGIRVVQDRCMMPEHRRLMRSR
jgi:predicted CoA-binding protein